MPLMVDIPFKPPENVVPVVNWGSIMHGMLLDKIGTMLGSSFHNEGLKPFSQYIIPKKEGESTWRISILDEDLEDMFLEFLESKCHGRWLLKQKGFHIEIGNFNIVKKESYKNIADRAFLSDGVEKRHKMTFKTITSFKKDGEYVIMPTTYLIIKSLFQRWDRFSKDLVLNDTNVRDQLVSNCRIGSYELRSRVFELEGIRITGFCGNMTIGFKGPDPLLRIADMLLSYSCYSGIGIKTALGMGGVMINE